ncbi:hypothetical protein PTI98_007942 [Pleurotus ostreatus]|nr:hypothetical protein PTI98_007942 [Pleurotus ostreatus]
MFILQSVGLFRLCFLVAAGVVASKARRNVTIDDLYGDDLTHIAPTYLPSGRWKLGGAVGLAKLNATLVHNQTWHDAIHKVKDEPTTVNFGFTGVAIYVYCVIPNRPSGSLTNAFADYKFFIDGNLVGRYIHLAENGPAYFYNSSVYVNTTMDNAFHNFSIVVDSTDKTVSLLFDYAIYTTMGKVPSGTSTTMLASTNTNPQPTNTLKDASASSHGVAVRLGAALGVFAWFVLTGAIAYALRTKICSACRRVTLLRNLSRLLKNWAGYTVGCRSGVPGALRGKGRAAPETLPPYAR